MTRLVKATIRPVDLRKRLSHPGDLNPRPAVYETPDDTQKRVTFWPSRTALTLLASSDSVTIPRAA